MPELPEVETVKEILKNHIIGKTIKSIDIIYPGIIKNISIESFCNYLKDKTILDIKRYGKYLIFCFKDLYMISHLRMEGKYFIKNFDEPILKHEHIIFHLDDCDLRYHDTRKFGTMNIVTNIDDLFVVHPLNQLGLEAFDEQCDLAYLKTKMLKKKPIKTLLLDQTIIAGIGNIYADEICFKTALNPTKLGNTLTDQDFLNIKTETIYVLNEAIKAGGTTIRSYTSQLGVTGMFQQNLFVHTMKKCKNCESDIIKIRVGGRGTYYCPNCQK